MSYVRVSVVVHQLKFPVNPDKAGTFTSCGLHVPMEQPEIRMEYGFPSSLCGEATIIKKPITLYPVWVLLYPALLLDTQAREKCIAFLLP